jgi:nitrogen regulatory protein PII
MQLVQRKRIEIFVEAHALKRVEAMLNEVGVKGWSVFNGVEGAGEGGVWQRSPVEGGGEMHMVIAITNEAACDRALDWLKLYFAQYRGVVAVADVSVLRPNRF